VIVVYAYGTVPSEIYLVRAVKGLAIRDFVLRRALRAKRGSSPGGPEVSEDATDPPPTRSESDP